MIWKTVRCGGSNKGVVVSTCAKESRIMILMRDGSHVIHDLKNSDYCDVVVA